jgi:hypothetical protein
MPVQVTKGGGAHNLTNSFGKRPRSIKVLNSFTSRHIVHSVTPIQIFIENALYFSLSLSFSDSQFFCETVETMVSCEKALQTIAFYLIFFFFFFASLDVPNAHCNVIVFPQVVAQKVKEAEITEQDSLLLVISVRVTICYFFLAYNCEQLH